MATSARLRGNQGLILTIKKKSGGTAASYADDVKSFGITGDDGDDGDLTFAEAAAGLAAAYTLTLSYIVSFDTGSLHAFFFDNPGVDVEIVIGPWGNATPSATKPHFKFDANTGRLPDIENQARVTKEGAEGSKELEIISAITKVAA